MSEPTKLYRYYDAAGALLYVGISKYAIRRLTEHEADKHWQADISSVRIETFPDRESAHAAERSAIESENPAHNLVRYAAAAKKQRPDRRRRTVDYDPPSVNWLCLSALASMYEETNGADFIGKYSFGGGALVALDFKRTDRTAELLDRWMRDAQLAFGRSRRVRIAGSCTIDDEIIGIDLVRKPFEASEMAEHGLSTHSAIHAELCADAPIDEERRLTLY